MKRTLYALMLTSSLLMVTAASAFNIDEVDPILQSALKKIESKIDKLNENVATKGIQDDASRQVLLMNMELLQNQVQSKIQKYQGNLQNTQKKLQRLEQDFNEAPENSDEGSDEYDYFYDMPYLFNKYERQIQSYRKKIKQYEELLSYLLLVKSKI